MRGSGRRLRVVVGVEGREGRRGWEGGGKGGKGSFLGGLVV